MSPTYPVPRASPIYIFHCNFLKIKFFFKNMNLKLLSYMEFQIAKKLKKKFRSGEEGDTSPVPSSRGTGLVGDTKKSVSNFIINLYNYILN